MSRSNRLERRLEAVRQMQTEQYKCYNVKNHSPSIVEFVVQFFPISRIVRVVPLDILVTDLWIPKIVKVQCDKC
ncbi:hypothetical protein D3C72_2066660 [compost metagenome]